MCRIGPGIPDEHSKPRKYALHESSYGVSSLVSLVAYEHVIYVTTTTRSLRGVVLVV